MQRTTRIHVGRPSHIATGATLLALCVLVGVPRARAAIQLLQNDGFGQGDSVGFQAGFVSGEMAGVTLGPVTEPYQVNNIQLLFGQPNATGGLYTVTLHIYLDTGGPNPGAELYSGDYQLVDADNSLNQIDVSGENILLQAGQSIRVAIQFQHSGPPAVARDDDGTIQSGRNWIYSSSTWLDSAYYGLTGDWVIRAEVNTFPTTPDAGVPADGGTAEDASVSPDAGIPADAAVSPDGSPQPDGSPGLDASQDAAAHECDSSSDCGGGQVCQAHRCVNVCQSDGDCSAGSRCHHGVCAITCTVSSQCAGGELCADGVCQPACASSADCQGGEVCRESLCRTACSSTADCFGSETCQQGVCLPLGNDGSGSSDSGCGCTADPVASVSQVGLWALLLLGLLGWRRRRALSTCL